MKIAVYLSSHDNLAPEYTAAAETLGSWMGRNGHTLVYGGARKGLMETLAQAVRRSGGSVYGVVPQLLIDRGFVSTAIDVQFPVADLADRKRVMVQQSDVAVALPGGIGTLDEVFSELSANTIGQQARQVVLCNVGGVWDSLIATLRDLQSKHLAYCGSHIGLVVTDSAEQLCQTLAELATDSVEERSAAH